MLTWEADWPDALRVNRYVQGRANSQERWCGRITRTWATPERRPCSSAGGIERGAAHPRTARGGSVRSRVHHVSWDGDRRFGLGRARCERKRVRPGMDGSWERLFHDPGIPAFLLEPNRSPHLFRALSRDLLERAIGFIYLPQTERWSHYFYARLAKQFDRLIHFNDTRAVEPLGQTSEREQRTCLRPIHPPWNARFS